MAIFNYLEGGFREERLTIFSEELRKGQQAAVSGCNKGKSDQIWWGYCNPGTETRRGGDISIPWGTQNASGLQAIRPSYKLESEDHRISESYSILSWKGSPRIIKSYSILLTELTKTKPED